MRGLLAQYVGLHSPAELEVAAFAPGDGWEWLKWVPHTSGARLASNAADASVLASSLEALLDERLTARTSDDEPAPLPMVHARAKCWALAYRGHRPSLGRSKHLAVAGYEMAWQMQKHA